MVDPPLHLRTTRTAFPSCTYTPTYYPHTCAHAPACLPDTGCGALCHLIYYENHHHHLTPTQDVVDFVSAKLEQGLTPSQVACTLLDACLVSHARGCQQLGRARQGGRGSACCMGASRRLWRARTHACALARAHPQTHTRTHNHAHTRTRTCAPSDTHTHTQSRAHAHTHTRAHTHHTHTHTRTRTHTHTHTHAHAQIHTHTQTNLQTNKQTNRQANGQTNKQTHTHTKLHTPMAQRRSWGWRMTSYPPCSPSSRRSTAGPHRTAWRWSPPSACSRICCWRTGGGGGLRPGAVCGRAFTWHPLAYLFLQRGLGLCGVGGMRLTAETHRLAEVPALKCQPKLC